MLRKYGSAQRMMETKGYIIQIERIHAGQVWDNLGVKVTNFSFSIQYSNPLNKTGMDELI